MPDVPESTRRILPSEAMQLDMAREADWVELEVAKELVDQRLKEYWHTLVEECERMPIRYDPPIRQMRKEPERKHFFSGDGRNHNRILHRRKIHAQWGRK